MKKGGRFGKYGDQKRLKRLRQARAQKNLRLRHGPEPQSKKVKKVEVFVERE